MPPEGGLRNRNRVRASERRAATTRITMRWATPIQGPQAAAAERQAQRTAKSCRQERARVRRRQPPRRTARRVPAHSGARRAEGHPSRRERGEGATVGCAPSARVLLCPQCCLWGCSTRAGRCKVRDLGCLLACARGRCHERCSPHARSESTLACAAVQKQEGGVGWGGVGALLRPGFGARACAMVASGVRSVAQAQLAQRAAADAAGKDVVPACKQLADACGEVEIEVRGASAGCQGKQNSSPQGRRPVLLHACWARGAAARRAHSRPLCCDAARGRRM